MTELLPAPYMLFPFLLNVELEHTQRLMAGVHWEGKSNFLESWTCVLGHIHGITEWIGSEGTLNIL